jgi:hypothetical protein
VGADADTALVEEVAITPANVNDGKAGGRLDWTAFGAAAERLLPQLLAEPIPYPPRPHSALASAS